MAALGVYQYLVKPFAFPVFRERLEAYREHREHAQRTDGEATQHEIDALLGRGPSRAPLPKGLSPDTLERVAALLRSSGPLSASEAGEAAGMSRVAVRRYLEHLTSQGVIARKPRYGTPGRPETEYSWVKERPGGS
jgi:response regulator of citrate/malate metabolism